MTDWAYVRYFALSGVSPCAMTDWASHDISLRHRKPDMLFKLVNCSSSVNIPGRHGSGRSKGGRLFGSASNIAIKSALPAASSALCARSALNTSSQDTSLASRQVLDLS